MFRARLGFLLLVVVLAGYSATAQERTPGFQNTVNNYSVGMNPEDECRHPSDGRPKCSQHFNFHFQANTDGTINAPFEITNDSLEGFCGRVHIIVRDRANPPGNILLDVRSGVYCIQGKGSDTGYHERVGHVDWTFKADPNVGINGHDLYMVGEEYRNLGINWGAVIGEAIKIIGTVVQLKEAIIP